MRIAGQHYTSRKITKVDWPLAANIIRLKQSIFNKLPLRIDIFFTRGYFWKIYKATIYLLISLINGHFLTNTFCFLFELTIFCQTFPCLSLCPSILEAVELGAPHFLAILSFSILDVFLFLLLPYIQHPPSHSCVFHSGHLYHYALS